MKKVICLLLAIMTISLYGCREMNLDIIEFTADNFKASFEEARQFYGIDKFALEDARIRERDSESRYSISFGIEGLMIGFRTYEDDKYVFTMLSNAPEIYDESDPRTKDFISLCRLVIKALHPELDKAEIDNFLKRLQIISRADVAETTSISVHTERYGSIEHSFAIFPADELGPPQYIFDVLIAQREED